ncbi:MAG: ABC transporter permease [Dissulfurispiraceae bacterium]
MKAYLLKRILLLIPLLLGITLTAFSLLKGLPGDPATSLVGERASPEIIAEIRKQIGADQGFIAQYKGYLTLLMRGDFGRSYYTNRDVLKDISIKLPNTMKLALSAMLIAVPFGITIGFIAAYGRNKLVSGFVTAISIAGLSIPVFWSAIIIMLLFSLTFNLFPPSGTGGFQFIVLPALVLSIPAASTLARVTMTSVADVMTMPYVNTARAKGLSPLRITAIHILRNAIIPIVTLIGLDFGSYLNGAVVTETIFGWDGIGRFTMEGIIKRDYPVILGCIVVSTGIFVIVNLMTDIIYQYLNPGIRLHDKKR